jgi:hypothetical protein
MFFNIYLNNRNILKDIEVIVIEIEEDQLFIILDSDKANATYNFVHLHGSTFLLVMVKVIVKKIKSVYKTKFTCNL